MAGDTSEPTTSSNNISQEEAIRRFAKSVNISFEQAAENQPGQNHRARHRHQTQQRFPFLGFLTGKGHLFEVARHPIVRHSFQATLDR